MLYRSVGQRRDTDEKWIEIQTNYDDSRKNTM